MSGFERNMATVIGINRYGNGVPPLQSAVPDAKAIAQILQDEHDYDVQLYLDEAATLQRLTALLQQLQPQSNDRLLFYFAGHGIAIKGDEGPEGYLIPQDARLGDVSTYLRMTEVEAALTQLPYRHCLIILDCCFAGAFRWSSTRKLEVIPEVIHKERYDRFIQDPAWQVITSASHDQYALDALDLKNDRGTDRTRTRHSPFAVALMDALSGDADIYPPAKPGQPAGDGVITATELYLYLRDAVEGPTDAQNLRQTPGLWCLRNHDKGEYIFLTPGHILNLPNAPSLEPTEQDNPYRGLKSYEREHGALFFGRTSLIEELCNFLCDRPFTVVLGASGSGKSSLVKAGLIPHLESLESQNQRSNRKLKREEQRHQHKHPYWEILAIVRPGEAPFTALKEALQQSKLLIADELQAAPLESQTLISVVHRWSQQYPDKKLLLVIDQAEELMTQCRHAQEREQFLQLLADLLRECADPLHMVLTLRSDFEPQLSEHPSLKSQWSGSRFLVPAMTREALRDVIEGPASAKVVYFETHEQRGSLVDQLIKEVEAMPGALPLLSFALSELYFKLARRFRQAQSDDGTPDRAITWQDYDELGGVPRSLTGRADQEYEALIQNDPACAQTTRNVMLRMVNIDGGSATKRKVPFSELKYPDSENDRVNQVVEQFVQARLLVRDNEKNTPYVEPAHDALIQGWQKLRDWIQAEGENLTLQRQLTPAAVSWQQEQQRIRFLWHNNPRLSLLQKDTAWLNQLEQTFVQRSIRQRQINQVRNMGIVAIVGVLSIAGIAFSRNSQINRMLDLQGSAEERLLRSQNVEALIESIKAARILQQPLLRLFPPVESRRNEVQETLQNAVYQIRERNRLIANQPIQQIAFSPNGQVIATVQSNPNQSRVIEQKDSNQSNTNQSNTNQSSIVSFWDRSGKPLSGFNTPDIGGSVQEISFTTDSEHVVVEVLDPASNQTIAKRWNLKGDVQLQEAQDVYSLGFNRDERMLLSDSDLHLAYSSDATLMAATKVNPGNIAVYRINPNDGQLQELMANIEDAPSFNGDLPFTIRFSRDNQRIAAASGHDDRIDLWDVRGHRLAQFNHPGGVLDLRFSPDGQQLATVGRDGTVRLWQHLEGSQYQEYRGYSGQNEVESIRLGSQNASRVAVGMNSGQVKLWDFGTSQELELSTPVPSVDGLRFSPDGQLLAVGARNGQTYLWNLATQQISPPMQGPEIAEGSLQRNWLGSSLWGGNFSPDGQWLILGGNDSIAHNILQPERQFPLPEDAADQGTLSAGWLHAFSFDPSQRLLAVGGLDEQLWLWNWKNLEESGNVYSWNQEQIRQNKTVISTRMPVRDVVFSPQGNLVAVAGIDGGVSIVRLLNLEGQQQAELIGHEGIINAVAFSPDGSKLATASEDGTARLWNLHGQQLAVFAGHDEVKHIAFRNNTELVTAGVGNKTPNGTVTSWQVKTWNIENLEQLLERGCAWIGGYLQNSPNLENKPEFKGDRTLCQDISSTASEIPPTQIYYLTPVAPAQGSTVSEPSL